MVRKKMAVGGVQSILNRQRKYVFDEDDGANYGSSPEPTMQQSNDINPEESTSKGVVTIGTKTFAAAFKQARTAGLDEFEWRGRRYNTKLKSEGNTATLNTVKSKSNDNVKAKATPTKLVKRNKNNNTTNNTNDKQTITKNRTKTATAKEQSKNTTNVTSRRKLVQPQQSRNQTKQNVTPSKQQSTTQSNNAQNQNSKLTKVYKDDYVYYYDKNGNFAGAFPTDNAKPKQSTSSTSKRSNNRTSTSSRRSNNSNNNPPVKSYQDYLNEAKTTLKSVNTNYFDTDLAKLIQSSNLRERNKPRRRFDNSRWNQGIVPRKPGKRW